MIISYFIFITVFAVILRPSSTLIHELGHGIPALIFTDKKVTLYLGSYGDPKKSFKVKIGRLELFFNKDPFNWNIGLCVLEQKTLSINKQIFIDLMGPLASLALSLILSYLVFFTEISDNYKIALFIFNVSTYFDFFINIVPSNKPIELHNNSTVFNDGKQIVDLIKFKKVVNDFGIGAKHYDNKEYKLATLAFEKVYKNNYHEDNIYQLLISCYLNLHDYKKALKMNDLYTSKSIDHFSVNDYLNSSLIKSHLSDYKNAINDYNKALEIEPENSIALNNRGYTLNLIEDYESAIIDFNKAIIIEEEFAYALNNRGFAKIKLGLLEDGLIDLEKSMTLDGTNSYCYLNYGVYYYDKKEYQKALDYFTKSKALDKNTHQIDTHLQKVKGKLNI